MELPKNIKVGGHNIKVTCPYTFKERTDINGQYDHELKEIRVVEIDSGGNKRTDGTIFETFIHELLHAIDFCTGHAIFTDNEKALEGISEGIYQVLVDNHYIDIKG